MARKCKQLVQEKGVLSSLDPKLGPSLPSETVEIVTNFYEISRIMPGRKDFISVRQEGIRVHTYAEKIDLEQPEEVFYAFKDTFPDKKIGFSKFAELRPQFCVLAGASGTHSVCVCTIHQNMKLMFTGARLSEMSSPGDINLHSYQHCLANIICNTPLPICYLGECTFCPGLSKLRCDLTTLLDDNLVDDITFKQWVSVDRSTLTVDDYVL